jgi:quercetin dioxygenase-like cupin family protein
MSARAIERRQLLTAMLGSQRVTSVDVREIRLEPGQRTGRHLHPCAVLGYIVAGSANYQVEGETAQMLRAGSAFYEPMGKVIADFSNASDLEPLIFAAFYLKDGDQDLITMLDEG